MLVAVTGANGFIGCHLCKELAKQGYEFRAIQRKTSKSPNVYNIGNLDGKNNWEEALFNVDVIIHCASKVHEFQHSSIEDYREIVVRATKEIAIQAVKSKVKRFIYISSIKVNGEKTLDSKPITNFSPSKPIDNYSITKLEAEEILKSISKDSGIELVIIRPPLVYGPKVGGNFLKLIKLITLQIPLPFSLINNKRSLIYVENLTSFIIKCINYDPAIGKTFVVSDRQYLSTPKLITLIANNLKEKDMLFPMPVYMLKLFSKLTKTKEKMDRITDSLEIDPSDTFEVMNWLPPYSLQEGIKKTSKWLSISITKKNKK